MRFAVLGAIGFLCLAPALAAAQQPAPMPPRIYQPPPRVHLLAQLAYTLAPGARICPDEAHFRLAMVAQMGTDPFEPDPQAVAVGRVHVTVSRSPAGSPAGFTARFEWTGSPDVLEATGSTEGPGATRRDCLDVVDDLATSLSTYFTILALRYADKLAPKPAQAKPLLLLPDLAIPLPALLPEEPPQPPTPEHKVRIFGVADATLNPLVARSVLAGGTLGMGVLLRGPGVSIEAGLRMMTSVMPAALQFSYGNVPLRWTNVTGVVSANLHRSFFSVGLVAEVGRLVPSAAASNVGLLNVDSVLLAAAGLHAGAERSFSDLVTLRGGIDAEAVAKGPVIKNFNGFQQTTPSISVAVAAGLALNLRSLSKIKFHFLLHLGVIV